MSKIKCFYHGTDLDGQCSAAIVKYKYPEAELYPISHGDVFSLENIAADDTVFMVDYCLQPFAEMLALREKIGDKLIWIDHHQSSILEAEKQIPACAGMTAEEAVFKGVRENGRAACELTWEYLFPGKTVPQAVYFLGRYDVFDHRDPDTIDFEYGFRINETAPENQELWQYWLENPSAEDMAEVLKNGRVILQAKDQDAAELCRAAAFEARVGDYRAIVLNKLFTSSRVFKSVPGLEKYDLMVCFGLSKNGLWKVSFYANKPEVDCAALAKSFGGGGHRGAAGASFGSFAELPFVAK